MISLYCCIKEGKVAVDLNDSGDNPIVNFSQSSLSLHIHLHPTA